MDNYVYIVDHISYTDVCNFLEQHGEYGVNWRVYTFSIIGRNDGYFVWTNDFELAIMLRLKYNILDNLS